MHDFVRSLAHADFGQGFVDGVLANGSDDIVKPLIAFLGADHEPPHVRAAVNAQRAALVSDIAHFASILHGRHPGVVDHAGQRIVDDAARKWLVSAIDGFAGERKFLNRLIVAAGPVHRQAGQERIAAMLAQQGKSFEMLATSERTGTPAGAAIAFVVDWLKTRPLLDRAALRLGIQPPIPDLPSLGYCLEVAEAVGASSAVQRAMGFGADQLLAQQRGLWHLVAARHVELAGE